MPEWYAAHVFQGTNGEVTVPESSIVLDNTSGLKFRSSYVLRNILPGTTIAKYWSEVVTLKKKQVVTVVAISEPVDFAN